MPVLTDQRATILQIINEVRRKLGLKPTSSLTQDTHATAALDYLNDVISDIANYGNWQELYVSANTTVSSSVFDYQINTSAVVQNIHELVFQGQVAPMRHKNLEDILRLNRTGGTGIPRQWSVVGVDVSSANPRIRIHPQPGTNENNQYFVAHFYQRPATYTTADGSVIPPFNASLISSGLLAYMLLDESRGTPTNDYLVERQNFEKAMEEEYNRYNGDSGTDTYFVPTNRGFRGA